MQTITFSRLKLCNVKKLSCNVGLSIFYASQPPEKGSKMRFSRNDFEFFTYYFCSICELNISFFHFLYIFELGWVDGGVKSAIFRHKVFCFLKSVIDVPRRRRSLLASRDCVGSCRYSTFLLPSVSARLCSSIAHVCKMASLPAFKRLCDFNMFLFRSVFYRKKRQLSHQKRSKKF